MASFINLKFPLRSYRRGFYEGNDTTIAAVTENIKTLLLTKKGERPIQRDLGCNLSVFDGVLFEQQTKEEIKEKVRTEIISALARWMPQVTLTGLEVYTDDDENSGLAQNYLLIKMHYVLNNAPSVSDSIQLKISQ